jgi:hypothetical protein
MSFKYQCLDHSPPFSCLLVSLSLSLANLERSLCSLTFTLASPVPSPHHPDYPSQGTWLYAIVTSVFISPSQSVNYEAIYHFFLLEIFFLLETFSFCVPLSFNFSLSLVVALFQSLLFLLFFFFIARCPGITHDHLLLQIKLHL